MTPLHRIAAFACAAMPAFAAQAQKPTTLYSFLGGADGASPYAGVTWQAGTLYGTTPVGGGSGCNGAGCGTVFKLDPATGAETLLDQFDGTGGQAPFGGVILHGADLCGTTTAGGASGSGTVFAVKAKTGAQSVLYSFGGGSDGAFPAAGLIYHGGYLYGTTDAGGGEAAGTVFAVKATTGAETVLYTFTGGADGGNPLSGLTYLAGALYGTTTGGGASGNGTVFKVDAKTGGESVLYSFAGGTDGQNPYAGVVAHAGSLYGTTLYGGASGNGTVYKLDIKTGAETILHSFANGVDGADPFGGLVFMRGMLYGTTYYGGAPGHGTVFRVDPATATETVLYSFLNGRDGANPYAALTEQGGTLYGTTQYGGTAQYGVVFSLKPSKD
jgi:uncharacterized repeat protein (TIGR03803 family)